MAKRSPVALGLDFGTASVRAMLDALASGIASVDAMVRPPRESYRPHQKAHVVYGQLYAEYTRLSERFGRYRDPAMRTLRQIAAGDTGKR